MRSGFNHTPAGEFHDEIVVSRPDFNSISELASFLEERLEAWDAPIKPAARAQIALDEIYSNIVRYSGAKEARFSVSMTDSALILIFEDDGVAFDPTARQTPDVSLPAEERAIGGLGIMMVRKAASDMEYLRAGKRNVLIIRYDL